MSSNADQTARCSTAATLNDSWEEVMFRDQMGEPQPAPGGTDGGGGSLTPPTAPSPTPSMIKLLLDAQRETSSASSSSSSSSSTPPPSSLAISLSTAESRSLSTVQSSRTSPKYNYSPPPTTPVPLYESRDSQMLPAEFINNDWVWDWSSRPEIVPPSDWGMKLTRPMTAGSYCSDPAAAGSLLRRKSLEAYSSGSSCSSSCPLHQEQLLQQSWWSRTAALLSLDNLPLLLFTHACTFLLGAATILVFMKKYYN